jgi:hypothetical protein
MKNTAKMTNLRSAVFCGCLLLFACFLQAQPDNQSTLPKTFPDLEAYPSPLENQTLTVALDAPKAGEYDCTVRDQMGWVVIHQRVALAAGSQKFELDLPLPAGLYYLRVDGFAVKKILKTGG